MKHLFRELFSELSFGIGEARSVYQEVPHDEPPPVEAARQGPLGVDPKSIGTVLKTGPLRTSPGDAQGDGKKVYRMETPFVVDVTDIQKKVAEERVAIKGKAESAMQKALANLKKAMGAGQTAKELLANASTDEQTAEAFRDIGGTGVSGEPEKPRVVEATPQSPAPTVVRTDKPAG